MTTHSPLPPFTRDTAIQKVRHAEDAWNSRNPEKVALAYRPRGAFTRPRGTRFGRSDFVGLC
jgi:nuclear transport factor 2 (NTF2) superfamily protein